MFCFFLVFFKKLIYSVNHQHIFFAVLFHCLEKKIKLLLKSHSSYFNPSFLQEVVKAYITYHRLISYLLYLIGKHSKILLSLILWHCSVQLVLMWQFIRMLLLCLKGIILENTGCSLLSHDIAIIETMSSFGLYVCDYREFPVEFDT